MAVTREELKKTQVIVDFKMFFDNKVKIKNQQNVVLFLNISPLRGPTQIIIDFLNMHRRDIWDNEKLTEVRQVQVDCRKLQLY